MFLFDDEQLTILINNVFMIAQIYQNVFVIVPVDKNDE